MLRLFEYMCQKEGCGKKFEALVEMSQASSQNCPDCGAKSKKVISPVKSWVKSTQRTAAQLKQRSLEHTLRAKREGRPLDVNETSISSDPVWRNKLRAKNTSRQTINQNRYRHVEWENKGPDVSPVAPMPVGSFSPKVPGSDD